MITRKKEKEKQQQELKGKTLDGKKVMTEPEKGF